ncbi:hypothetical protein [Pseudidiomarina insulisalsae]|uniref:Type II secretion system protein n=1 Tax=Pseudidiomarina insulisalsae TaxID=575789 RepID=A0A432YLS7_9GAMM|nr:hypothetical protein [Pseudidiomarina insulisalsae]RUO61941.1 hypothetical protein CWI71_06190 [Pseudidiomarina insulisalsae]
MIIHAKRRYLSPRNHGYLLLEAVIAMGALAAFALLVIATLGNFSPLLEQQQLQLQQQQEQQQIVLRDALIDTHSQLFQLQQGSL